MAALVSRRRLRCLEVLADELAELKRRRAEKRAQNRALAKQEKALRKRRSRLMQVGLLQPVSQL